MSGGAAAAAAAAAADPAHMSGEDIASLIEVFDPHMIKCFKGTSSEDAFNSNSLLTMLSDMMMLKDAAESKASGGVKMSRKNGDEKEDDGEDEDEDDDEDEGDKAKVTKQKSLLYTRRRSRMEQVVMYVVFGDMTMDLMSGKCSKEIDFMGFEHLFEYDCTKSVYVPLHDKYTTTLRRVSPQLWWLTMRNLHERRTLHSSRSTSTMAKLRVMDGSSIAAEPLVTLNPDSGWTLLLRRPQSSSPPPPPQVDPSLVNPESVAKVIMCSNLPWLASSPVVASGDGVVLAGGCLESMLLGVKPRDVDLFLVVGRRNHQVESEASVLKRGRDVVMDTITAIFDAHQTLDVLIFLKVSTHVTTITVRTAGSVGKSIIVYQIIHRVYASAAQVVAGFDIDSCRLFFDGRDLRAHDTAFRAWRNGWNLFDAHTLSTTAVIRYTKKYRAGLGILVVGMDDEDVASFKSKWPSIFEYVSPEYVFRVRFFKLRSRMLWIQKMMRSIFDISVPSLLLHTASEKLLEDVCVYDKCSPSDYDYTPWHLLHFKSLEDGGDDEEEEAGEEEEEKAGEEEEEAGEEEAVGDNLRRILFGCDVRGGPRSRRLYNNVRRHFRNDKVIVLDLAAVGDGKGYGKSKLFTGSFNPVKVDDLCAVSPELRSLLTTLDSIARQVMRLVEADVDLSL